MVQGTDARWHAHFASLRAAAAADATASPPGTGLDFGTLCAGGAEADAVLAAATGAAQDYFGEAAGVAFPLGGGCGGGYGGSREMAVLRGERTAGTAFGVGQSIPVVGSAREAAALVWPFIQLYDLGSSVTIRHGPESVELEYGTTDGIAALRLDREVYPPGADVHLEISDAWLNVDPTDEDSWTWDVGGEGEGRVIYRAFGLHASPTGNTADVSPSFGALGCEDTCSLQIDLAGGALEAVGNGNGAASLGGDGGLVTLVETGPNTGVFASYDSANSSSLKVSAGAPRGTAATVSYSSAKSVSIAHGDASLDVGAGGQWPSGTRAGVTLSDTDANRNSRQRETLDVSDAQASIPTIITGSPLTLAGARITALGAGGERVAAAVEADALSARAIITPEAPVSAISVDYGAAAAPVPPTLNLLLNYDLRSTGSPSVDATLSGGGSTHEIASGAPPRGLVGIPREALAGAAPGRGGTLLLSLSSPAPAGSPLAIVADVFAFGVDGGRAVASQVVRLELEETGADTGTFAGSIEYSLAGARGASAYADLATIGDRATMVAADGGEDVTLTYGDLAADGSRRPVSGTASTASHTGTVSFDRDEYGTSDTVTVTLRDADLNTSPDTAESYRVGPLGGGLLVLTINGVQWAERPGCPAPGPDLSLLETGPSTGVFVGQLRVPAQWCDGVSPVPQPTARAKIGITYADRTDARGTGGIAATEAPRTAGKSLPLAISDARPAAGGLAVALTGPPGTALEVIAQVYGKDGAVERIVSAAAHIGGGGTARAVLPLGDGGDSVRVFAWRDGLALAEAHGPLSLRGASHP
ncbi:MAG: hypothetical protein EB832_00680 [Thaumarchaeota archaeon S14]|nr:MAG: hypothetical protein EB832_00680 [Thaumarchaeota archaeon S14]